MAECFYDFQTADSTDTALTGRIAQFFPQILIELIQIQFLKEFFDSSSSHANAEFIAIHIQILAIFRFSQQLFLDQRRIARVENDKGSEIQYFFQRTGRDIENQAHPARNTFKIPNMRNRCSQFDMTHSFATDFGTGYFNAATVADDTFITNTFIFAAMAFPVLGRPKDAFAKQAVPFRFQRTVIDCFRLFDFAMRPFQDFFR